MKKTLFLSTLCLSFCGGIAQAEGDSPVVETITLKSDKISGESFTETAAGNGMFYSDNNKVAFLAAGTKENPYYISAADDTHADAADISLSYGSGHTVTVGGFTGDSCLAIGTEQTPVRVYTENSLFVGGYGWHNTSGWRTNAVLNSNTRGEIPFEAHEGTIVINKGSTLDTGTGTNALGGAQIYIGHGGKGSVIVDGGTLTSRAFIGVSTSTATPDDNSGLLEIKNGGKVYLKAEPDKINSYYNQLLVGNSTTGTGSIVVSGEGSEFVMESSALTPQAGTGQSTHWSFVSIGSGNKGNGVVTVTDGATMTLGTKDAGATQISLAEGTGSTATFNVSNGGKSNFNGNTLVGYQGTATLNVESGSQVNHSGGALYVGYANGSGVVNVNGNGASLSADNVYVGSGAAKGSLNIGEGSALSVAENVTLYDTANDGFSNSLSNSGEVNIGGYLYLTDGTVATNSGSISATGDIYIADGSSFTNESGATLESTGSFIILYAGSSTTNNGIIKAKDIYVEAGAELTNTGSMIADGGESGITLSEGAAINNEGILSGQISGKGTVQGTGTLGDVSIGADTSYVVGDDVTPIYGVEAATFTLQEASLTVFNVDGATAAQVGETATWGSGLHSAIYGTDVKILSGAGIEIVFSDTMDGLESGIDFELKLIDGGEGSDYGDLAELLSNTTFSLAGQITTFAIAADDYELTVTGAQYTVKDNDLYLSGSASVSPVPEPTTATLSLLALAALAARRRRR